MDGLKALRWLFFALLGAPVLILAVLTLVFEEVGSPEPGMGLAAVAAGAAGIAGAWWAAHRPLPGESPQAAAVAYRSHFFLGFALGEAGLLITFVLCFLQKELWPYLIGLPSFLAAMALVAPTDRNIERRQQDLMSSGSSVSLREALRETPPA